MADLKTYDMFDFTPVIRFIRMHGRIETFAKGDYFCREGEICNKIGIVENGAFAFSRPDYRGNLQILSLAMRCEFVGFFINLAGRRALFDVTALCEAEVCVVDMSALDRYIDIEIGHTYRNAMLHAISYGFAARAASYRCDSPDSRYRELLTRSPGLADKISMTAIASYLGISREHFARMRTKNKNL